MTSAARWRLAERGLGLNRMVALSLLLHLLVLSLSLVVKKGLSPLQHPYTVTLLPKENRFVGTPPPTAPNAPSPPKSDSPPANKPAAGSVAPPVSKEAIGLKGLKKQTARTALPAAPSPAPKAKGNPLSSEIRPEAAKEAAKTGGNEEGIKEADTDGRILVDNSFKFPYYLQGMENKISGKWMPPFTHQKGTGVSAVVRFTVKKNGAIELIEVETTSGNNFFDEAAMRAIYGANPFPPLPRGFSEDALIVHFTFTTHATHEGELD